MSVSETERAVSRPDAAWAEAILDSVADGVFTVDRDRRITYFNRAAEEITGVGREEAVGRPCCEVFRADICEAGCAIRACESSGKPVVNQRVEILRADGRRLPISVSAALLRDEKGGLTGGVETFRDLTLVEELRKELLGTYTFQDIIGKSDEMRGLFSVLPQIAESESTVLVTGESGTGKELVARAIHSLSPRKDGPFVAVNCGALPEELLGSELFGHVEGAFTGATRERKGRFAAAGGGTIFLDEIGDVTPALQVRLLRVLQEREYEPVGSSTPLRADVRVVCATNREIDSLVKDGALRQDLYYRINVVRLHVPPLRERREDIPLLVDHFIEKLNDRLNDRLNARPGGRDVQGVSGGVLAAFMAHDWPGNVRELENAIEHAFVLCRGGVIEPWCLPQQLRPAGAEGSGRASVRGSGGATLEEIEKAAILAALERNDGRKLATARELGINKTTLWRKLRRYGIQAEGE